MLNPFPELLTFGLFAPLLLRVVAGLTFLYFGYRKLTKEKHENAFLFETLRLRPGMIFANIFGILELAGGAMLVLGFYTQIAAIVLSVIALGAFFAALRHAPGLRNNANFYALLLAITLSLLVTGAGAYAIDLPL